MAPPTCRFTGRHTRYLFLLAFLSYFIYFLVHGLQEPISSRYVYICDTGNEEELTQCLSLDDVATCANLLDTDGNAATCIESSCGYRLFPHIDVSIMGSSDPYDPNAGTSISFLAVVSAFYSLVPYILGFVYLVEFLAIGNLVPLGRLVVLGVISVVNELIFKKILQQNRPDGSCLYFLSFGMPSGHAATSIGLLAYLLLEIFVFHPNLLCGITCQKKEDRDAYTFRSGYGWQKQDSEDSEIPFTTSGAPNNPAEDSVAIDISGNGTSSSEGDTEKNSRYVDETNPSSEPLLDGNETTDAQSSSQSTPSSTLMIFREKWVYHLYALGYILLLVPVPLSRVYLHDHLREQVLIGAAIGAVASMVWYLGFVRNCGMRVIQWRESEWGKWWGLKFGWEEGFF